SLLVPNLQIRRISGSSRCLRQAFECLTKIADEVVGCFQANMESDDWSAFPYCNLPFFGMRRENEAFEAAPAITKFEQRKTVNHRVDLGCRHRLELHREQAAGTFEITLPNVVPRRAPQGRMQDLLYARLRTEPFGNFKTGLIVPRQTNLDRAKATQAEIDLLRARACAYVLNRLADRQKARFVGRDHAQHRVRMTDDVFRARLDHSVNTKIKRLQVEWRRPCVVDRRMDSPRFGDRHDGGNVLHVESTGPRRFHINKARIGFD